MRSPSSDQPGSSASRSSISFCDSGSDGHGLRAFPCAGILGVLQPATAGRPRWSEACACPARPVLVRSDMTTPRPRPTRAWARCCAAGGSGAAQPAGAGTARRLLGPAHQLHRDGPVPAQRGDGAAARRAPRRPRAGAQRPAAGGRLRPALPGDPAGRPGDGRPARGHGAAAAGATSRIRRWWWTGRTTWWRPTGGSRCCWTACRRTCSTPPLNAMRLTLHPEGLAPRIRNLREWRGHLLAQMERQIALAPLRAAARAVRGGRRLSGARGGRAAGSDDRTASPSRTSRCRCGSSTRAGCCPSSRPSPPSTPRWT